MSLCRLVGIYSITASQFLNKSVCYSVPQFSHLQINHIFPNCLNSRYCYGDAWIKRYKSVLRKKKYNYSYLELVNETLRTQMNAGLFCIGYNILMLNLWKNKTTEERAKEVQNESKTSYKKIIMMFLISKSSPNCLFSSHQTIDGQ